ncbi:MAG: hypothetical protein GWP10_13320 [Nitrospiraceae bacterium]|nr:hypothetical protein [Nitrospiraceae bacterium]
MNELINNFIKILIEYKEIAYLILFFGSMFETVIGFSFFIYGEIIFLSGAILAGMGILNIWIVTLVLYLGGIIGDTISYFLGRKYGLKFYFTLSKIPIFKYFINKKNYKKGLKIFRRYGALSAFLGRLLGPISWITPFILGIYKLDYKKFLPFEIAGVIIGIGQFIIIGYIFGRHFETILNIVSEYSIFVIFIILIGLFLFYYLKKIRFIYNLKKHFRKNKKYLIKYLTTHSALFLIISTIAYFSFLFFIFFINKPNKTYYKTHSYNITYLKKIHSCKDFRTYYIDNPKYTIQPINIILISKLSLNKILNHDWIRNDIFGHKHISFKEYIHLLREKVPPVSSLYFLGLSQNYAYQYKNDSLSKREHIRLWVFDNKNSSLKKYYTTISFDNGYDFTFYYYFFTPIHKIDKNIDKSRDFFYKYLESRKDLNINCKYIQTKCKIKEIKGDNEASEEQMFYTDGKILECFIK